MTEKSAAELEREAEATRARVAATADSIRDRMTPGQLFDEFTGIFRAGIGSDMLQNLKAQVRDNPLPLTVIGAGLAWLMLGSGASQTTPSYSRRGTGQHLGTSGLEAMASGAASYADDTAGDAIGTVSGMVSGARDSLSEMASGAAETVSGLANSASETITNSAEATADMATRASRSAQELLQDQPLAVAAVGLALGAAIGAMLPHTQVEDDQLGEYREKLRREAKTTLDKGVDAATQVAAEAYQAATEEAGRQASKEGTLADRVGEVVKSAAERTEDAVREQLANSTQSEEANSDSPQKPSGGGEPKPKRS
ncbi:DUF3618 domain-containing protein [Mesorhizobium sp. B2-8-9]|uniref:DUF3618 domain-containing protein n=1 Tax=Mesorhizobium sp. B2-8-9 TaxID=2589899 RepID=UPI00112E396F|nr:DUF3618 domain-containing protein [Mesorhizobium sp. B2-8-9]TPI72562.1 DUF3618 domain-containing protein [Mesorhizobium sp. B2-8-9]